MSPSVMAYPDFKKPFILTTDACIDGFGAILSQSVKDKDKVIAYASRSTNKHERSYITSELECAALIWAVDKFRIPYLLDNKFTFVTDHRALEAFRTISGKSAKLERWSLKLQDLKYTVVFKPGKDIPHVDCLSRNNYSKVAGMIDDTLFIKRQREMKELSDIWKKYDRIIHEVPVMKEQEIELSSSKWDTYVIKTDGKMYHRLLNKKNGQEYTRLIVPCKYRRQVLKETHDKNHFSY